MSTFASAHKFFDSNYHGKISSSVQKQIASILCTPVDNIIFSVQSVQQQMNTSDCGVFAIAFLVKCLFDGNPTTVMFDVVKMSALLS